MANLPAVQLPSFVQTECIALPAHLAQVGDISFGGPEIHRMNFSMATLPIAMHISQPDASMGGLCAAIDVADQRTSN